MHVLLVHNPCAVLFAVLLYCLMIFPERITAGFQAAFGLEMSHYYNLPAFNWGGMSDSKLLDLDA